MKICIARLRSGTNYKEPLNDIIDSFYDMLRVYTNRHKEHEYYYYNFGFNNKPIRDNTALEKADVIVIPSEAEFTYWVPGKLHGLSVKRSNEKIEEIMPYFKNKKVIILRSDRADNESLYREKVLRGIDFDYQEIDEIDFIGIAHALKWYYINDKRQKGLYSRQTDFLSNTRPTDFIYWGTDKSKGVDGKASGDIRHLILKRIHKSELNTLFIGSFKGFKRDLKFRKMKDIVPLLEQSKTTLCFNWYSNTATSSRYVEALACDVIPFVWAKYDSDGRFVKTDWQRVYSVEEFVDKVKNLDYNKQLQEVKEIFLDGLPPTGYFYDTFDALMEEKLKK